MQRRHKYFKYLRETAMSVQVTEGIEISVEARYAEEESSPGQGRWIFAYEVTIANKSARAVRLLSRHWVIKDAFGRAEEVRGEGVVGQTPRIDPGASFSYTSWCPLPTDFGSMRGAYLMQREDGFEFDAKIAPFALCAPSVLN
jgi:ApaG protein